MSNKKAQICSTRVKFPWHEMEITITPQKVVEQTELQITLVKRFEFSYGLPCVQIFRHRCRVKHWRQWLSQNTEHKSAAPFMKSDWLVGHLLKKNNNRICQDCIVSSPLKLGRSSHFWNLDKVRGHEKITQK